MTVELSEFVDGIGFGLHPTSDPVVVRTSGPEGSLTVCPADSDLATIRDIEQCDTLHPDEPTALPPTSGERHIGLRISTDFADQATGTVTLAWNGADSFFAVQPGTIEPSASRSIAMTSTSAGEVTASLRPDGAWEIEFAGPETATATTGLATDDGSPVRVVLAEYAEAGEWTLTYINRSGGPQTPIVHFEWPVVAS